MAYEVVVRPAVEAEKLSTGDLEQRSWGTYHVPASSEKEAVEALKRHIAQPDDFEIECLGEAPATNRIERQSSAWSFVNVYEHCGVTWEDTWTCACNDRCPECNTEIEPVESIEKTIEEEEVERILLERLQGLDNAPSL